MDPQIDTATKLYGLIGHPVAHSRSPYLQNELIRRFGINARYLAFDVPSGDPEAVLRGAYEMGVGGFNVTVPYKQAVMPFLKKIDEKAALIGAVNTLKYEADGWHGYNSDMPGLMRAFSHDDVILSGKPVVILGAGGAANAAVCAAAECGAADILIVNRTVEKAQNLCERFSAQYAGIRFSAGAIGADPAILAMEKIAADGWIAIQTTSVGMHPKCDEAAIEDPRFYRMLEVGYDIIFNPQRTRFMELSQKAGARAYNGLKMLMFQGVRSFEIWNGVSVDRDTAEEVLKGMEGTFEK